MSPANSDRNLLFGILALQADLVSRDSLIAAMSSWASHKVTPLGQVLLDQGALDADGHALVEALVRKSLARHGADADQALTAFSSIGSARQGLEQIADVDVQASLSQLATGPAGGPDADATPDPSAGTPTSSGLRFRVLRPHAKGGLGEVFVARDEELRREVALKQIQARHADHRDSRARFVLEAEVTGGLEHPGIVPVYGLGYYADGRPFYAMRFVKGDSLKDAIERFHKADGPGRDVGERTLALRELLGRFIDVCNAIAYAHSRGVLHRDLKPGNVMLGKYGETLVVDWGLAKVVGRPEGAAGTEEGTLRPSAASDSAPTQLGSALGTPAYMSPEQAAGRLDVLGPASDVYSLGATLYCLLTGQAPFDKDDLGEVLQKVQRGEFLPPRQVKGSVPPALEAICLKAMALAPGERYESPQALADDLEHWLADEPVRVYREPWTVRLGRWRRRHRAKVAGLTAAAVVAVLLGGAGLLWWQQQAAETAQRQAALRQGVKAALDKAAEAQHQARWGEAEAVLEQAQDRLGETGPEDLRRRVAQARDDLQLVRRLDAARLKAATVSEGSKFDWAGAEQRYAAAFQERHLGQPGDEVEAVAARLRTSRVKDQLVAALDDWAWLTRNRRRCTWLLAVARAADPDPWRDRFRHPKVWQDRKALKGLAREAKVEQLSPQVLTTLGKVLMNQGADPVPLLTAAQWRAPQDFWLNFALGHALQGAKRPGEAVGYYRAALALRPQASVVYNNLGVALKVQGQVAQAMACFRQALKLDPKDAPAHTNLGNALKAQGEVAQAMACYRQALKLDPKYALAHYNLGLALYDKGQLEEAMACYRQALKLDPKYAPAHSNLGVALKAKGQLEEAMACYCQALKLDPKYVPAHNNLGNALKVQGQVAQAMACYRQALKLDPKFALAHNNLGLALHDKGQLEEAIACFRQALKLDPKDAQAHYNLGNALKAQGQVAQAIACYRQALKLDPKLVPAHSNLGVALQAKGQLEEAIVCYRQALRLDPKDALAHCNLGLALLARGEVAQAIACYRQALKLDPKFAKAHGALGQALLHQGRFTEARESTRRCLELLPPRHPLRPLVSRLLRQCERLLVLEARLPAVLKGESALADAAEHLEYASLCQAKQRYAASARFCAEAFAVDPKLAADLKTGHRYNAACYAALVTAGQGQDAGQLTTRERAHLRQQAVAWLRADLTLWTKQLAQGTPQARALVRQQLAHWQRDSDLAGIRDAAWIVNLPAEELRACRQLWTEVAALLQKAVARP